jgi:hypothetical protein
MAIHARHVDETSGLIHHSDRCVQHLSIRYTEQPAEAGINASVGSRGDSYDNALAESINGLYKTKLDCHEGPWHGPVDVESAALTYTSTGSTTPACTSKTVWNPRRIRARTPQSNPPGRNDRTPTKSTTIKTRIYLFYGNIVNKALRGHSILGDPLVGTALEKTQQNHVSLSARIVCATLILTAVTAAALVTGAERRSISLSCSLEACILQAGAGDAGWYMKAGQALAEGSWIPQQFEWIYRLWPPGMPAIYGAMISVWGTHSHMGLLILIIVILATTAMFIAPLMRPIQTRALILTTLAGLTIPFASFMTDWPLGTGFAYADGISVSCLFVGSFLVLEATQKRNRGRVMIPIAASLFIAVGAYLRATGETFADIFMLVTLLSCIPIVVSVEATRLRRSLQQDATPRSRLYPTWIAPLLLVAVLTQMWLAPWRIYAQRDSGTLTFTSAQVWSIGWMPDSVFKPDGSYFIPWGINGLCRSYPIKCAQVNKLEQATPGAYSGNGHYTEKDFRRLAISSIAENPRPWLQNRISLIWRGITTSITPWQSLWFLLTLLGLAATCILSALLLIRRSNPVMVILLTSLAVSTFAPIFVSHFEPRYLLSMQLVGMLSVYAVTIGMPILRKPKKP